MEAHFRQVRQVSLPSRSPATPQTPQPRMQEAIDAQLGRADFQGQGNQMYPRSIRWLNGEDKGLMVDCRARGYLGRNYVRK